MCNIVSSVVCSSEFNSRGEDLLIRKSPNLKSSKVGLDFANVRSSTFIWTGVAFAGTTVLRNPRVICGTSQLLVKHGLYRKGSEVFTPSRMEKIWITSFKGTEFERKSWAKLYYSAETIIIKGSFLNPKLVLGTVEGLIWGYACNKFKNDIFGVASPCDMYKRNIRMVDEVVPIGEKSLVILDLIACAQPSTQAINHRFSVLSRAIERNCTGSKKKRCLALVEEAKQIAFKQQKEMLKDLEDGKTEITLTIIELQKAGEYSRKYLEDHAFAEKCDGVAHGILTMVSAVILLDSVKILPLVVVAQTTVQVSAFYLYNHDLDRKEYCSLMPHAKMNGAENADFDDGLFQLSSEYGSVFLDAVAGAFPAISAPLSVAWQVAYESQKTNIVTTTELDKSMERTKQNMIEIFSIATDLQKDNDKLDEFLSRSIVAIGKQAGLTTEVSESRGLFESARRLWERFV